MEEKELVQRSIEGDEDAFGVLVKKYNTKVFNLAYSLTRNRDVADDLAQEVFIKVYFALPKFKFKSKFGTWLYQITSNHIKDFLRKRGRINHIPFEETRVKHTVIKQESEVKREEMERTEEQRRELMYNVIQTLSKKHQIILSLRDIQGFSYGEISKILRISPGTVDSRLHRARKMLRKKISPFLTQKGGKNEM